MGRFPSDDAQQIEPDRIPRSADLCWQGFALPWTLALLGWCLVCMAFISGRNIWLDHDTLIVKSNLPWLNSRSAHLSPGLATYAPGYDASRPACAAKHVLYPLPAVSVRSDNVPGWLRYGLDSLCAGSFCRRYIPPYRHPSMVVALYTPSMDRRATPRHSRDLPMEFVEATLHPALHDRNQSIISRARRTERVFLATGMALWYMGHRL